MRLMNWFSKKDCLFEKIFPDCLEISDMGKEVTVIYNENNLDSFREQLRSAVYEKRLDAYTLKSSSYVADDEVGFVFECVSKRGSYIIRKWNELYSYLKL